jgi:2Fe-2S ferredoxin
MTQIIFIEHNGTRHEIDAADGESVMRAALDQSIPGIDGDCGGCCSCATCHGYVETPMIGLPERNDTEIAMLAGCNNVQENSRLTCQIVIFPELDGLTIRLPESQF